MRTRATTPRRASSPATRSGPKYIAETFLEDVVQRNSERGMLGYTGTFKGKPVSVQSSGMGCPSAAIVIEELVQLGVKKLMRVGTCGGLQPDLSMGDLIVALSATPADSTATHYVGGEPHAPTADFGLVHEAVHQAKTPRQARPRRADRVERHLLPAGRRAWPAAGRTAGSSRSRWRPPILFTLGALRKIQAGCMLIVSDVVVDGEFVRITDEEMRSAVDQMTELALATVDGLDAVGRRHRLPRQPGVGERRRRGAAGRSSPVAPPRRGSRATRSSASGRATSRSSRARRRSAARGCSSSSAATAR